MKKTSFATRASIPAAVVAAFLGSISTQAVALEPALIRATAPDYPRAAERRGIEGLVTVSINIAADGSVASASVVTADPAGVFDSAALSAVKRWKFESGKPTDGVQKNIKFQIEG